MSYHINENKGDIIYEVVDRELVLKVNPALFEGLGGCSGGSECSIEIIKKYDQTPPTDQNVFSSLRTLAEIKSSLIEANGMFLRKDIDDIAYGVISHDKELKSTIYVDGWEGKGWEINSSGHGEFDSLRVRSDIYANGHIGSPTFASGFAGWGLDVDMTKASAEMDNLFVRKTFTVYELVYSQVYGLGGSMITSDLNKIASVTEMNDRYRCFMDSMDGLMMMNLRKGDGIRIQRKTLEGGIKYIFSRCLGVTSTYFDIQKPIIAGSGVPETGDFAFRWGNNEDVDRQGLIYQTSSDSGAPFIDVYDGITGDSTEGCLKVRLGKLSGIRTQSGEQLAGYGAYLNGIYIENSQVILDGGDTIEQRFVVMNGKLDSQISGIRQDMSEESGNLLKNSSFSENTNYWDCSSVASFINVEGAYLWQLGSFYIEKTKISDIITEDSRKVLRIRNNSISQPNRLLKLDGFVWEKTESVTDPDTGVTEDQLVRQKYTFSVAFMYKVIRPGTLKVGFANSELYEEISLNESSNYLKYSKAGKWDGLGDLKIEFTGEIRIYGASLFNDELADATIKLWTQIYQDQEQIALRATKEYVDSETKAVKIHYDSELKLTAEQISAQATRIDNINNTIATAGWLTTADGNKLWASQSGVNALGQRVTTAESSITQNAQAITQKVSSTDFNGNTIASKINQTSTTITISASKINLQGAVTFSAFDTNLNNRFSAAENNASNALQRIDAVPSWAKQAQMQQAMTDQGLIVGGYMKMSLIDVNNLYCKHLDAATGSMGGFDVQNGGIFSTSYNTGQSNTKFSLYSSGVDGFLAFTATNIWAGIGVNCLPAFSGLRALGRFENWVNSPYTDNYGIVIDVRNGYHNTALVAKGGIQLRGGFSAMESVKFIDYSNGGGSDSIQNWCLYYNQFCIKNRTSYMSMYLPRLKSNNIGEISGDDPGFILDIVIEHTSTYQVNLCVGDANTFIKDHNGNTVADNGNASSYGNVNMGVGDSIRLLYKNQVYYILNRNN